MNWLPWPVLKISGLPYLTSASSTASRQKSTSMQVETRHDRIRRVKPIHDRGQIDEAAGHRNVGDIHRPHLVRPIDRRADAWTPHGTKQDADRELTAKAGRREPLHELARTISEAAGRHGEALLQ